MARGTQGLLTLPINLWPAETRLLLGLIATWSVFGLLVLASASWWVSQQELGDALYTIKRQLIWMLAGWALFSVVVRTPLKRWLQLAAPALLIGTGLVAQPPLRIFERRSTASRSVSSFLQKVKRT